MADYGVEVGEPPAGGCPIGQLEIGGQGAVVMRPLIENQPMMPYFRQIIKIARVLVNGKYRQAWGFRHFGPGRILAERRRHEHGLKTTALLPT